MRKSLGLSSVPVVLLSFVFAGCQKTDDRRPSEKPVSPAKIVSFEDLGLAGRWVSGCSRLESGNSSRYFLELKEFTMIRTWAYFKGAACVDTQCSYQIEETYKDPEENSSELQGWKQVTLEVGIISATPVTAVEAEGMNQDHAFGYSDWLPGVPKPVNGRRYSQNASQEPEKGKIREVTLRREGSTLKFARYVNEKAEPSESPTSTYTLDRSFH